MPHKHSLCAYLWNHIVVDLMKAEVRCCCKTPSQSFSHEDIHRYGENLFGNTHEVRKSRIEMLGGGQPATCQVCWDNESRSLKSHRSDLGEWERHIGLKFKKPISTKSLLSNEGKFEELALSTHPENLDIQLDNSCDLKCLYCDQNFSSSWEKENLKLGQLTAHPWAVNRAADDKQIDFENYFWSWFEKNKLGFKRIAFLGGEPLYSAKFYNCISKLDEAYQETQAQLEINIITNMNSKSGPFTRFLEYLLKAQNKLRFNINISMDSWGKQAEYIRSGLNFSRFQANFERLCLETDPERVVLSSITSLSHLCASGLGEYVKWLSQLEKKYNRQILLYSNLIVHPKSLSLDYCNSVHLKQFSQVLKFMENENLNRPRAYRKNWEIYMFCLRQIIEKKIVEGSAKKEVERDFHEFAKQIDRRRGSSLAGTFLQYKESHGTSDTLGQL